MAPVAKFMANPYPFYRRLRARDPVHWDGSSWMLTRYVDVVAALHDPRLSSRQFDHSSRLAGDPVSVEVARHLSQWMLYSDPPSHTRLRSLAQRAFTPRSVEILRSRVQGFLDDLLDTVQAEGQMDVIRDVAYPLPAIVIAELLGVPPADRDLFKQWSDDLFGYLGNVYDGYQAERAAAGIAGLSGYLVPIIERRRRTPEDDLISRLIAAQGQAERLSDNELVAFCTLLLIAGHETSTNLIGNGLLALLQHPDQIQHLREDASLIGKTVEEVLRYDPPVQLVWRQTMQALEIGGRQIEAGQVVLLNLAAANRDPDQFREPDRFDITRQETRHVGFGYGAHFCLGAPLARLEGQLALQTMLHRFSTLHLASETLEWHATVAFRRLKALPVTF